MGCADHVNLHRDEIKRSNKSRIASTMWSAEKHARNLLPPSFAEALPPLQALSASLQVLMQSAIGSQYRSRAHHSFPSWTTFQAFPPRPHRLRTGSACAIAASSALPKGSSCEGKAKTSIAAKISVRSGTLLHEISAASKTSPSKARCANFCVNSAPLPAFAAEEQNASWRCFA